MKPFYILALLLISVSPLVGQGAPEVELSVYLPDYRVKTGAEPNLYRTTQLILFSAKPRPDGSVDFSRINPDLLAFGEKARAKQVRVTVCVGGWGRGKEFAGAVSTPEHRTRFAGELQKFCEIHSLDGVDIDWEFPKGEQEHADLAAFLELLSGKLRASGRLLTIALGYTRPLPSECWQYVDYVNLMSYQPWNDQPYAEWLDRSVDRFLEAGLPKHKLLVGVGFFAKEKAGQRRAVSWRKIGDGLPESEHGYWPVGKGTCDLRIDLVKQHGLGGIMVWDYGHDTPDPDQSLLRYLSEQIRE